MAQGNVGDDESFELLHRGVGVLDFCQKANRHGLIRPNSGAANGFRLREEVTLKEVKPHGEALLELLMSLDFFGKIDLTLSSNLGNHLAEVTFGNAKDIHLNEVNMPKERSMLWFENIIVEGNLVAQRLELDDVRFDFGSPFRVFENFEGYAAGRKETERVATEETLRHIHESAGVTNEAIETDFHEDVGKGGDFVIAGEIGTESTTCSSIKKFISLQLCVPIVDRLTSHIEGRIQIKCS